MMVVVRVDEEAVWVVGKKKKVCEDLRVRE